MSFRPAVFASLAVGLAMAPSTRSVPAAATLRYRIEAKNQTTVDLSAFGQAPQEQSLGLTAWVVVTLSDTTGGRVMHVVVDSAKYEGTLPLGQESVDSAKGGVIHGFVDASGRVKNLEATPRANLFMAQIQGVMGNIFPRVKGGAKAGDTWTDTTEVTNNAGGANTKTKLISQYTAGAQESVSGLSAMRLKTTYTSSTTGTLDNQMGTMEIEGTGSGTGAYLVGSDGSYLGSTSTTSLDQKLKTAMAPAPIPVKTVQTLTVTLIK
jgi:hypothetical protein